MSCPHSPLDLREAAAAIRTGRPLPPAAAEIVADAIEAVAAGERDAAEAFGLAPLKAGPDAWQRRDGLVRQLAGHFPGPRTARAKMAAAAAGRYAAASWPRYRSLDAPPPHHHGKPEALMFELHRLAGRSGVGWPLAWRRLDTILQSRFSIANGLRDDACTENQPTDERSLP